MIIKRKKRKEKKKKDSLQEREIGIRNISLHSDVEQDRKVVEFQEDKRKARVYIEY